MCTSSPQHQRLSLSLFPLSPSPGNKPTFLHKFFTPFSLVLSVLFPFASEEQQYPGEDLHLKEQYPGEQQYPGKDRNPSANRSSPSLSCPLAAPLYPPPDLQCSLYLLGKIKKKFLSLSCGCGVRIWFGHKVCICDFWFGYLWVLIWTSMGTYEFMFVLICLCMFMMVWP